MKASHKAEIAALKSELAALKQAQQQQRAAWCELTALVGELRLRGKTLLQSSLSATLACLFKESDGSSLSLPGVSRHGGSNGYPLPSVRCAGAFIVIALMDGRSSRPTPVPTNQKVSYEYGYANCS